MAQIVKNKAKGKSKAPLVSVVMSVYNGEKYLREAIDSILNQTFNNFEFIIIDDGSTDSTLEIIKSYKDPRIILISRENKGLVPSLNEGIKKARGKYIARMDADDISYSDRLFQQVQYMNAHPECIVLSSFIELMDSEGKPLPPWYEERIAINPGQIRSMMIVECCIAHPAVMMRKKNLPIPTYHDVPSAEDWDLWLRLLRSGEVIHKIPEILLSYRVHRQSITQSSVVSGSKKIKNFHRTYLWRAILDGKFDFAAKRYLRELIFSPVKTVYNAPKKIIGGTLHLYNILKLRALSRKAHVSVDNISIIAPWLNVGGADKVVLDVANGLSNNFNVSVLITEKASNEWVSQLKNTCSLVDLGAVHFYKARQFCMVRELMRSGTGLLIISNSQLAYATLPLIKKYIPNIRVVDILHGQGGAIDRGGSPQYSQPYRQYIDHRVAVSRYMKEYMAEVFREDTSRMTVIYNGIDKRAIQSKHKDWVFSVVWVGRLSDEKKPLLALRAFAQLGRSLKNKAELTIVGDGPLARAAKLEAKRLYIEDCVNFLGFRDNARDYINDADCLLLTSEMEGLGIVLIEAIHSNTPIVASRVGGVPEIVKDGINGYCVDFRDDADLEFAVAMEKVANWQKKNRDECRSYNRKSAEQLTIKNMVAQYKAVIADICAIER